MEPNIYLFEADDSLSALLVELLHDELDATVSVCHSLAELQQQCAATPPDLIVADFWGASHLQLADANANPTGEQAETLPPHDALSVFVLGWP